VTPSEALHTRTLGEASAILKDDTRRKVLLRSIVVVAQKGLAVAPDGVAECEPNVLTFPLLVTKSGVKCLEETEAVRWGQFPAAPAAKSEACSGDRHSKSKPSFVR
jgi:hypothetical protein